MDMKEGECMNNNYIVIDLEATGPKFDDGDRLFQIGCVLIDGDTIVQEVEVLVNPEATIPPAVEQLTGVSNKDVMDAPYFDEVAAMVHSLVADRIVIAHNVSFDYPFLVTSFSELAGIEWSAECIDTVQLAQVLLPTAESYRLSDLSAQLGIEHVDAHSAGSDASATARLFLWLKDKIRRLPAPTQAQLRTYAPFLIEQTGMVFEEERSEWTDTVVISPAIRLDAPTVMMQTQSAVALYEDLVSRQVVTYSETQAAMISYMEQRVLTGESLTWIEAEPGAGKTLAYLLVALTHATPERPIWLATSTLLLQHQLVEQELRPIMAQADLNVSYATIKGQQHYISLTAMQALLRDDTYRTSKYALAMMGLLVWLTETTTGDLTECSTVLYAPELWERLTKRERKKGVFDYYKHAYHQALQASVVITNHAYIARHLPGLQHKDDFHKPVLFLDEVQHIEPTLEQHHQATVTFDVFWQLQQQWSDYHLEEHHQWNSKDDFASRKINRMLLELCDLYEEWREAMTPGTHSAPTVLYTAEEWPSTVHFHTLQAMKKATSQLLREYRQFTANPSLTHQSHHLTESVLRQMVQVTTGVKDGYVTVALMTAKGVQSLQVTAIRPAIRMWHQLEKATTGIVGLSATIPTYSPLFYQVVHPESFLQLPEQAPTFTHHVFLPTDLPVPTIEMTDAQVTDMASWIWQIYQRQQGRMLVLVHSIEMLESLASALEEPCETQDVTVLVQRTQQSSRKLQRRFQQETNVLLLGVSSFWEGFDSGDVSIDTLIMTKLPFPNPTTIDQQVIAQELTEQGRVYFTDYALPRMLQQFYQGLGRMSRPQQAPAEVWILDVRAAKSAYALDVQACIPAGATILSKPFKKLLKKS